MQFLESVRQGWPLHPDTVAARNELILSRQVHRPDSSLRSATVLFCKC
jgi:hypothetical protein